MMLFCRPFPKASRELIENLVLEKPGPGPCVEGGGALLKNSTQKPRGLDDDTRGEDELRILQNNVDNHLAQIDQEHHIGKYSKEK